jgi:GT2 family glycosyltransferase
VLALKAAVVLASAGRSGLLRDAMMNVDRLDGEGITRLVSVPDEESLPEAVPSGWQVVTGTRGLAAQRNAALAVLDGIDVVFFFDDDAVVREDYLVQGLRFFVVHPEAVGLTGRVLIDGASTSEIPQGEAVEALTASRRVPPSSRWRWTKELYGCNFAFRMSATPQLRFDDRLPLYSWLEDHDFARRLLRFGPLAEVDDCLIVHRGAASGGRTAHVRLGYSQLMNPVHLWKKGSFPAWLAAYQIFRPAAKNLVRSVVGSDRNWRRKRLHGNALALRDALWGRITPERIVNL